MSPQHGPHKPWKIVRVAVPLRAAGRALRAALIRVARLVPRRRKTR